MTNKKHIADSANERLAVNTYRMQGLFRFLLAMMVLWSHSTATFFPETQNWLPKLQLGNVAVSAFFVLSGYLMSEAIAMWYSGRLLNFISNRYLRISPPLFVAAAVSVMVHFALLHAGIKMVGLEDIPKNAISVRNAISSLLDPIFPLNIPVAKLIGLSPDPPHYAFVRYSWAIFTEIIFYWMLLLFFIGVRIFGARMAALAFILGVGAMFLLGTANYHDFFHGKAIAGFIARIPFVTNFQWAPHFLVGALISLNARHDWSRLIFLAGLAVAGLMALIQLGLYTGPGSGGPIPPLCLFVTVLILGFHLILSKRREYTFGPFRLTAKLDQSFGSLSYPIYINQFSLSVAILSILLYVAGTQVGELPAVVRVFVFVAFNLSIICAAAVLIFLTDTLTHQLRDRIRGVAIQATIDRPRADPKTDSLEHISTKRKANY